MKNLAFSITAEPAGHAGDIETLLDAAFGIDRRIKTSYRLREGRSPVDGLSFVAWLGEGTSRQLVGTISFWAIKLGDTPALLLGPLAVEPEYKGLGCGIALMRHGLDRARALGHRLVMLVGDQPYYARVGFARVPDDRILMPGPQDPDRLLYLELEPGAFAGVTGLASPA